MRRTAVLDVLLSVLLLVWPVGAGTDGGSTRRLKALWGSRQQALTVQSEDRRPWVEPVSWKPRAFVFHNFLTPQECDHYIKLARPFMRRSTVVGSLHAKSTIDGIRTSYGTFINRLYDPIVASVEQRVALWTKLNISHQEDTQVLRYGYSQQYGAHYDSILEEKSPRIATMIMYLTDVEEGGETAFTQGSEWIDPSLAQKLGPFSECAEGHVAMKPKRGDALLFWGLNPDGTHDPHTMHTACPVISGVKWVGIKWIHTLPFRPEVLEKMPEKQVVFPEDCADNHELCAEWAANGECESNAPFMRGDGFAMGACRAACGDCELCHPSDLACKNRNRERAGYLPYSEDPSAL